MMAWEPFVRLSYINVDSGGFTESGGAAALVGVRDDAVSGRLNWRF
jgi:outer membrane autotransporter protein